MILQENTIQPSLTVFCGGLFLDNFIVKLCSLTDNRKKKINVYAQSLLEAFFFTEKNLENDKTTHWVVYQIKAPTFKARTIHKTDQNIYNKYKQDFLKHWPSYSDVFKKLEKGEYDKSIFEIFSWNKTSK